MKLQINFKKTGRNFDRDEIEEALDDALTEAELGEVTGGGAFLDGSGCDITVDVNDAARGLEVVRQVLVEMQVPSSTTIDECDDSMTTVAVHPVYVNGNGDLTKPWWKFW